jgi:hypothetical protein
LEEALESLLLLKDTMCSGTQRCTIAPSAKNSFKEVFPHLISASRSTNVANIYPNATFATPSPLNNEFLKLYEEEMELINSADKTKLGSSSAESPTAVSESTTLIMMHVVNKTPKRKEIINGKWMPVEMQSDGNTQLSLSEAESRCVSASSEHNAAKKNGRTPPTRSEKTPLKPRANNCKSRAASKRTLDFVDGIDHGSQKMRPIGREANVEVMDWQECIENLLQEQPEDRMDCELDSSTELPLDLEMSDVSTTGVDFSSPEGSPDLDELMVGWESPSSFEISC